MAATTGKYLGIHTIYYYLAMQFLGGAVQSSGWPGVVTVVANWFGKGKKGFVFGVWNAHTSIGNIVGGLLAGKVGSLSRFLGESSSFKENLNQVSSVSMLMTSSRPSPTKGFLS